MECCLSFQMNLGGHQQRIVRKRLRIKFLLDEPASRFECRDEAGQHFLWLGNDRQHQASVNQIKGRIGKRIGDDVMATYLHIRKLRVVEETRIEIGYQDMSRGSNASG